MNDHSGRNWVLHVGDCREALRQLPARSVHTVVTSPPFWALRDYGLAPSTWGGDPECDHVWSEPGIRHKGGPQGKGGQRQNRSNVAAQNAAQHHTTGQFCTRCNAWRVCLGLEPDPEMFIDHMTEVFREVWRVLRDDGTVWLNMGDSYASGNSGYRGTHHGDNSGKHAYRTAVECHKQHAPLEGQQELF